MPQISGGPIRLNRADPINRGRLRFWPLREGGNKWAEDVGPWRRHGALGASPTQGLLAIGKSRVFGAANNYVNVGQASDLDPLQLPLTITAWIKQTTSGGYRTIFGQYSDYATPGGIGKLLRTDLGVLTYYTTSASGNYQSSSGGPSVAVDTLTFVAIVIEGTVAAPTWRLMANSTIVSGSFAALRSAGPLTNPSYIGNSGRNIAVGPSEEFKGHIALPSIWNRALTNTELRRLLREPDAGALRPSRRIWYTAQLSAGSPHTATPGTGSIALAGQGAAVAAGASLQPGAAALAWAGQAATAAAAAALSPGAGALAWQGATAAVAAAVGLQPGAGALAWHGQAASASGAALAAAGAGALSWAGHAPSVAAGVLVSTGPGQMAWQGLQAAFGAGLVLAAGAGAMAWHGQAATVVAAVTAAAGYGAIAWQGQAPSLQAGAALSAGPAALAWHGQLATVSTIDLTVLADPPASRTYTVRPRRTTRQVTARSVDRVVAPRSTDRTIT